MTLAAQATEIWGESDNPEGSNNWGFTRTAAAWAEDYYKDEERPEILESELADLRDYLLGRKKRSQILSSRKLGTKAEMASRFKALLDLYQTVHGVPFSSPIDGDGDWIMEDSTMTPQKEG
ncbi:hypothetical protein M413DRAFT_423487 [Hebeloma cylindrosporum]|uniref:Uncharacterized protein n=1 Tax=Hebeloma cylindrosporum TaxID=76867 RepID=A0A0C3BKP4_HEBCY|nr:hypothetical protein M413DRAFT_423487 [Hebeloma cylindrosporum h7]